jgi:hypothetical protein
MKFRGKIPFRLIAVIACIGILIILVGCVHSIYLNYFTYEGKLVAKANDNCSDCRISTYSEGESSLTLKFDGGEERLTVSAYDADGYGGHFYIPGWLEIQNYITASHLRTTKASVSFAIECSGNRNLSLIPSMLELIDVTTGHSVSLTNFTEYSPGSIFPSKTSAQKWIPLDKSDNFDCLRKEVRTVVAKFDFEPSMKTLQFNFAGSIFIDGEGLVSPSVLFTITPHKQFLYKQISAPVPI